MPKLPKKATSTEAPKPPADITSILAEFIKADQYDPSTMASFQEKARAWLAEQAATSLPRGEYVTTSFLAECCGVDLKTIHNWVDKGLIPHFRTPGRHIRVTKPDARAFLEAYGYTLPKELAAVAPTPPPQPEQIPGSPQ